MVNSIKWGDNLVLIATKARNDNCYNFVWIVLINNIVMVTQISSALMILHTEYHMRTNGTSLCVSAIEILLRLIMPFHVTIDYGCFESFPFRQNFVTFVRQITWFRWNVKHWTSGINVHNKNPNRYVPF